MPPDRWLFPHVALHCSSAVTLTARRHLQAWPAMAVLGRATAADLGRPLHELGLAELYSCFPAAVRVQQRELGLPTAGTPSDRGDGVAGGPFNHSSCLDRRLGRGSGTTRARARSGHHGVGHALQTRSGRVGRHPAGGRRAAGGPGHRSGRRDGDPAGRRRPPADPVRGTVVSFTVTYGGADRLEPERTVIVADLPDGVRTAATCEDASTARAALAEGLVGRTVELKDTRFRI